MGVALTGGEYTLMPALLRAMLGGLVLAPGVGEAYAAREEEGRLVGFLAFSNPGELMFYSEESRAQGYYEYANMLPPEAREYFLKTTSFPPVLDDEMKIERQAYRCNFAFVRAEYQGKGVAKGMFNLAFQRAVELGAEKVATITINPINVPIYKALGFTLKGQKRIKSPWSEWDRWFFVREMQETT
ncbi:hypothetical protein PsYK624_085060 [Phanerochaete sordida]|uniref:N-acetyltransferase domain-containing protein n=1 Tax=Phanerochaete sordida TaxID=48140 RepID=A0A9P3LFT2_9APHY|nr:hypothetical protein PsYK624_085060 [Phanerochaete sordida]